MRKKIYLIVLKVFYSGAKNIIVIDGGSEDKTIQLIKKFKVDLIQVKKLGLANQRNIGISKVKN